MWRTHRGKGAWSACAWLARVTALVSLLHYTSSLLFPSLLRKPTPVVVLNHNCTRTQVRPVVKQQKKPLLEKWLKEKKLEPSEELGDLVTANHNANTNPNPSPNHNHNHNPHPNPHPNITLTLTLTPSP